MEKIAFIIISGLLWLFYEVRKLNDLEIIEVKNTNFPVVTPSNTAGGEEVVGIDLSHYQGTVDWQKVAQQKIHFAFIKATQGRYTIDNEYKNNWAGSEGLGLIRGVYHYLDPSINAKEQAKHFIQTVKNNIGDIPPIIDIEAFENIKAEEVIDTLTIFADTLENYYNCKPIIYTSPDFWNQLNNHNFGKYQLWLADYNQQSKLPNGWDQWLFWQYDSNTFIDGIEGPVDRSKYSKSVEQLQTLSCPGHNTRAGLQSENPVFVTSIKIKDSIPRH